LPNFDIYFIVPEGKFVLDTVHSVALQDSTKDNSQKKTKKNTTDIAHSPYGLKYTAYILHTP